MLAEHDIRRKFDCMFHHRHPIFERGSFPYCAAEVRKIIYMQKSAKFVDKTPQFLMFGGV
jgi:hypothetical protein